MQFAADARLSGGVFSVGERDRKGATGKEEECPRMRTRGRTFTAENHAK